MIVYKITNQINGKIYIGQTIQKGKERWYKHLSDIRRLDYPLYRAMRKYGKDNFKFEVIVKANNMNELNIKERELITLYKSTDRNIGYNILAGGDRYKMPQVIKDKISKYMKGKIFKHHISKEEKSKIARKNALVYNKVPSFTVLDKEDNLLYQGCILSDCSRQLKIPVSTIYKWVRGKRKSRNYKVLMKEER